MARKQQMLVLPGMPHRSSADPLQNAINRFRALKTDSGTMFAYRMQFMPSEKAASQKRNWELLARRSACASSAPGRVGSRRPAPTVNQSTSVTRIPM
jgi:hypothetical protein